MGKQRLCGNSALNMKSFAHQVASKLALVILDLTIPLMITAAKINRNCTADCTCEKIEGTYNILVVECRKRDTISEIPRLEPDLMADVTEL